MENRIDARNMTDEEFIELTNKFTLKQLIYRCWMTADQAVKFVVFNDVHSWSVEDTYIDFTPFNISNADFLGIKNNYIKKM